MHSNFPLFQSHLDLAHQYWKDLLKPGDYAIDATCGNGKDTLQLAQLVLQEGKGKIYAFDIQSQSLQSTKQLLLSNLTSQQIDCIDLIQGCHSIFSPKIEAETIKLIVYNLGYLPGGDKSLTTQTKTTLESLNLALKLIKPGGGISLTCYPGHHSGELEEEALISFAKNLSPKIWSCCHHRWLNRHLSPSLLFVQKSE